MKPSILIALALVTAACGRPPATTAPPASATVAFCAFGGQGIVPANATVDDYVRVVVVVDVTTSAPVAGVTPKSIALLAGDGGVEASMTGLSALDRIAAIPPTTSWAEAINDRGVPFDGKLPAGTTRLRVEASLSRHPRSSPARARVELASDAGPIHAEGAVAGEWPTG